MQGYGRTYLFVALNQKRQSENGLTGNNGRRTVHVNFVKDESNIFPLGSRPAILGGNADEGSQYVP